MTTSETRGTRHEEARGPGHRRPRTSGRAGRRRAAWAAGIAVAAVALFACYLRQSRTVSAGSDGASQALQAWDLVHGNPLLHGWWVTDVSFYTTELPQYALTELARGLTADVIHVAGAMTYTLLVLTAALLARGRAPGASPMAKTAIVPGSHPAGISRGGDPPYPPRGASPMAKTAIVPGSHPAGISRGGDPPYPPRGKEGVTRAVLAAGIMLAPQLGPGTRTLVLSPDHAGTSVPVLMVFLLIERAPVTWYVPVLVWLGLAWTALADAMTIFVAVIPLALVCAVRVWHGMARNREPFTAHRRDASLAAAAVLAVPAELIAAALIRAHGGWQVSGLRTALAGAWQLPGNARLAGEGLLELFGADIFGAATGLGAALAAAHLVGLTLAVGGAAAAARRFLRRDTLIESVLVTGIVIDLAAYLAGVQAVNILSTREIAPVLPFAAVLAGRLLARRVLRGQRRRALRRGLCAALALYAASLGYAAAQPPAAPQYADLAAWLRGHHLTTGLSGYHQANIVTLETGGAVTLRPVIPDTRGRLVAYTWNASTAWYDPAAHTANFLVLAGPGSPGSSGLTAKRAVATFGPPARSYRYLAYEILVWHRGTNLLAGLRGPIRVPGGSEAGMKH